MRARKTGDAPLPPLVLPKKKKKKRSVSAVVDDSDSEDDCDDEYEPSGSTHGSDESDDPGMGELGEQSDHRYGPIWSYGSCE